MPWPHFWLIGTTDAPYDGPIDRPTAGADEVDELLAAVNHVLDVGLRRDDVVGTYAGLRPLIAPSDGSTITASREHRVVVEPNGLVRVSGGKYTTYRLMAEQTIDAALGVLGERPAARPVADDDPAPGRRGRPAGARSDRGRPRRLGRRSSRPSPPGSSPATGPRRRTSSRSVARRACSAGWSRARTISRPRSRGPPATSSRCRSTTSWPAGCGSSRSCRIAAAAIAPRVAAILGAELGWDATRQAAEVEAFLAGARREFAVP